MSGWVLSKLCSATLLVSVDIAYASKLCITKCKITWPNLVCSQWSWRIHALQRWSLPTPPTSRVVTLPPICLLFVLWDITNSLSIFICFSINYSFIDSDPSFNFSQQEIQINVSGSSNVTPYIIWSLRNSQPLINSIRTISFVLASVKATGTTFQHFQTD